MSFSVTGELVRQLLDLFTLPPTTSPASSPTAVPRAAHSSGTPTSPGHGRGCAFVRAYTDPRTSGTITPPKELSSDSLEQILMRCDLDSLLGTVPAVCRAWRQASESLRLWRHRLSPKLLAELEPLSALGSPMTPSRLFLITQGRNLLRNPTFRRDANTQSQLGRSASKSRWQRNAWVTTTVMGDGVAWELPPAGIRAYDNTVAGAPPPPLPYPGSGQRLTTRMQQQQLQSLFGNGSGGFGNGGCSSARGCEEHLQGCLATPNDWCEVVQVVDLDWELQRRGLSAAQAAHLLDSELSLRLSVHVGSRWDCVSQYSIGLILDEGNGNANGYGYGVAGVHGGGAAGSGGGGGSGNGGAADDSIPSLQSFVMRPTRHHFYTGRACCTSDRWQRFEYVVPVCPRGSRRAVVILRGRRAPNSLVVSPMPRFCGAKFASAELAFL